MSKKIVSGSQLTDNWAAKCVLLKKRFTRLTDGDLTFDADDPGSEGRMFDALIVKTGMGLDSLHQLVYGLLKGKDVPMEVKKPAKETIIPDETVVIPPEKEVPLDKDSVTEDELALRELVATKKEKIIANFYTLSERDMEYDTEVEGSFYAMIDKVALLLGLSRDAFVSSIKSL